ncbi:hypothetical protein SAMN04490244_11531 [Tranquillimonas rosea]|uniref:Uncharacterized protein n=1 Tax=Tranquillimonas rosea TaxID=641238 RepID=A0A1H9WZL1_9RHOB|nr:hypothetical protein [Tranquillimonas rosea]SES39231.1 hypothetical protein SAMN04490244_11531 [Tranquillimonas rosea]
MTHSATAAETPVSDTPAARNLAEPPVTAGSALRSAKSPRKVRAVRAGGPRETADTPPADALRQGDLAGIESALGEQNATLGRLSDETAGLHASVQFTEAYLTIGLAERMGEVLRSEVGAAERWHAAHDRQKRRAGRAVLAAAALAAALVVELETGALGPLYGQAVAGAGTALSITAAQLAEWGETGLRVANTLTARVL